MSIHTDLPALYAFMVDRTALHSVVCHLQGVNTDAVTYLARLNDETLMAHAMKLWRNYTSAPASTHPTIAKKEGAVLTTAHNGHIPFAFWFSKLPNHHYEGVETDVHSRRR